MRNLAFIIFALIATAAFGQSKIAVTIVVDGDKDAVQVSKFDTYQPINPADYARLELFPMADLPLTIRPSNPNVPIECVTVNNSPCTPLYGVYSVGNLVNGDLITIKVGQPPKPTSYAVTLMCNPEAVSVYHGSSFQPYALTAGAELHELQVNKDDAFLRIEPQRGYRIASVETGEGSPLGTLFEVKEDMMVIAESEEYPRSRQATIYLQPTLWSSQQITLAPYDSGASATMYIEGGYNTLYYNALDFPARLQFVASDATLVYLNGELVDATTPEIYFAQRMPDLAVVKIFAGTPSEHEVTFDCELGVKYRCKVDRTLFIQGPSYRCIGSTEMVLSGMLGPIDVRADGEIIPANSVGEHCLTITRDTHISIRSDEGAITEVVQDLASQPIYDILGRQVLRPHRGIYLRSARKLLIK